mmetsp:Transcript_32186/g.90579  ORF Transcript_32186/g.90579 Transcript_32186/m.90579 type:complete len:520 (-) Transcript_32186:325-1884(-)
MDAGVAGGAVAAAHQQAAAVPAVRLHQRALRGAPPGGHRAVHPRGHRQHRFHRGRDVRQRPGVGPPEADGAHEEPDGQDAAGAEGLLGHVAAVAPGQRRDLPLLLLPLPDRQLPRQLRARQRPEGHEQDLLPLRGSPLRQRVQDSQGGWAALRDDRPVHRDHHEDIAGNTRGLACLRARPRPRAGRHGGPVQREPAHLAAAGGESVAGEYRGGKLVAAGRDLREPPVSAHVLPGDAEGLDAGPLGLGRHHADELDPGVHGGARGAELRARVLPAGHAHRARRHPRGSEVLRHLPRALQRVRRRGEDTSRVHGLRLPVRDTSPHVLRGILPLLLGLLGVPDAVFLRQGLGFVPELGLRAAPEQPLRAVFREVPRGREAHQPHGHDFLRPLEAKLDGRAGNNITELLQGQQQLASIIQQQRLRQGEPQAEQARPAAGRPRHQVLVEAARAPDGEAALTGQQHLQRQQRPREQAGPAEKQQRRHGRLPRRSEEIDLPAGLVRRLRRGLSQRRHHPGADDRPG